MSDHDASFLGIGWGFPPTFSRVDGGVGMVASLEDIRESLWVLFSTALGERIMQPGYGCDLWSMAFSRLTASVQEQIRDILSRAILHWEPRIDVLSIEMEQEPLEGRLLITLDFRVRQTNTRSNMVYPFSLREATIPPQAA